MKLISAVSAALGGAFLIVKAAAILATGNQPPLLFELAPIPLAVALQGLLVSVKLPRLRHTVVQSVIILVAVAAAVGVASDLADSAAADSDEFLSSLLDVIAGFGPVIALIILGQAVMASRLWQGKWRLLPLALGVGLIQPSSSVPYWRPLSENDS